MDFDTTLNKISEISLTDDIITYSAAPKKLIYPLMLIDKISEVELLYFKRVLFREDESGLQLMRKLDNGGYERLGFVEFSLKSLITLNKFLQHKLCIKESRTVSTEIDDTVFTKLLLER